MSLIKQHRSLTTIVVERLRARSSPRLQAASCSSLLALGLGLVVWFVPCRNRIENDMAATRQPESAGRSVDSATLPMAGPLQTEEAPPAFSRESLIARLKTAIAQAPAFDELEGYSVQPNDDVRRLMQAIAVQSPLLALEVAAAASADVVSRYKLAAIVAETWGESSPTIALKWAADESSRWSIDEHPPLFAAVLNGVARRSPLKVVEWTTAALQAAGRMDKAAPDLAIVATQALVQAHCLGEAREALAGWIRSFPVDGLGPAAFELVAVELARQSPAEGAVWLTSLPPSMQRVEASAAFAAAWAEGAPADAMRWAQGLVAKSGRERAICRVFDRWASQDVSTALEWVARNEADEAVDAALFHLLSNPSFQASHPQVATGLAEVLADDAKKSLVIRPTVLAWAREDLASAVNYLQQSPWISSEEKADLINAINAP